MKSAKPPLRCERIDIAALGGERVPLPADMAEAGKHDIVAGCGKARHDVGNHHQTARRRDIRRRREAGEIALQPVMPIVGL